MDKAWRSPSRPASEDCSPPADRHDISTDRVPRLLRIRLGSAPKDALRREALLLVHGLKGRDPPGYIPSAEVKRVAVRSRRLLMRNACLLICQQSHMTRVVGPSARLNWLPMASGQRCTVAAMLDLNGNRSPFGSLLVIW